MNRILLVITALASVLTALVLGVAPASADTTSTTRNEVIGQHDAGWMRVVCKGTETDQRCHLRVPGGFSKMTTTYIHGGDMIAVEETFPYRPHSIDGGSAFSRRITTGVRVSCEVDGSSIQCEVLLRGRVSDFAMTTWSAGDNYGGFRGREMLDPRM